MSDRPPPDEEPPAEPKPKKKKRKKVEDAAAEVAPAARSKNEALDALIAAFDAGNYRFVRDRAPGLLKSTEDDEVRAAARDLLRRIDPDPIAKWMMAGAGLLLATLAGWYWIHAHGGP
jgi:hypothetical protein